MLENWLQAIPTDEAYRINRILYDIQHNRAEATRYFADPKAYIAAFDGLSDAAVGALERTDITRLYLLGANPYLLRAYCLQLRVPEPDYLAQLRAAGREIEHG